MSHEFGQNQDFGAVLFGRFMCYAEDTNAEVSFHKMKAPHQKTGWHYSLTYRKVSDRIGDKQETTVAYDDLGVLIDNMRIWLDAGGAF